MPHDIHETCIGCTACAVICPTEAIFGERKGMHVIVPERCIDCGACGSVCPADAITDQFKALSPQRKRAELPKAVILPERCTGCEYCVHVCPYDCLDVKGGTTGPGVFGICEINPQKCVGCGLCVAVCDKDAIVVYDKEGKLLDHSFLKLNPAGYASTTLAPL